MIPLYECESGTNECKLNSHPYYISHVSFTSTICVYIYNDKNTFAEQYSRLLKHFTLVCQRSCIQRKICWYLFWQRTLPLSYRPVGALVVISKGNWGHGHALQQNRKKYFTWRIVWNLATIKHHWKNKASVSIANMFHSWLLTFLKGHLEHMNSTTTLIAMLMRPTWNPPESCRPQMDPM